MIGRAGAVVGQEVDFAGLAGGDLVAVFADDAQARGLADLADRAAVFEPFNARYDRGALCFGAAIEFVDALRPQPLDPFFLQPGRHRRGHMKHDLQARQVVAVAHLVGQRPDPVHHGGHEIDPLYPAGLDQAQAFRGVEFDEAGDASAVRGDPENFRLLEQVFTPEQYASNVETVPGSGARVEFAIKLPGQREDGAPRVLGKCANLVELVDDKEIDRWKVLVSDRPLRRENEDVSFARFL